MSVTKPQVVFEPLAQPRAGRWWALAALVLSALVIGLDSTVLITALPTLSEKLGATTSDLQWIAAAYTLALGGLLLPGGVLGDRFGRKRLLLVGIALFGISSILASLFTDAERPKAVAAAAAGTFLGLPLGPLVAGYLLTHYAWGSVFLINAPVTVLGFIGIWMLVPESRDPNPRGFDVIGGTLAVAGVTALVYGVIEQPLHGWGDGRVQGAIIGGLLVLVLFTIWDLRQPSPFVDLRNFRNRAFTWATVAFVMTGFALFGVMFIMTPYLQIVMGNDAQATGIRLLPMIAGVIVGAGAGNRLSGRLGARVAIPIGLLVTAGGLVLFSRAGTDTTYGLVATSLAIIGIGIGTGLPTSLDVILGVLPGSQTGAGTALTRALQQIAASFGVAILGSLLNSVYQTHLTPRIAGLPAAAQSVAQGSLAGAGAIAARLPGGLGRPIASAAKDAYSSGMIEVMVVSAVIMAATAIGIAVFLPSRISKIDEAPLP